jgi:hypothetical protein
VRFILEATPHLRAVRIAAAGAPQAADRIVLRRKLFTLRNQEDFTDRERAGEFRANGERSRLQ